MLFYTPGQWTTPYAQRAAGENLLCRLSQAERLRWDLYFPIGARVKFSYRYRMVSNRRVRSEAYEENEAAAKAYAAAERAAEARRDNVAQSDDAGKDDDYEYYGEEVEEEAGAAAAGDAAGVTAGGGATAARAGDDARGGGGPPAWRRSLGTPAECSFIGMYDPLTGTAHPPKEFLQLREQRRRLQEAEQPPS